MQKYSLTEFTIEKTLFIQRNFLIIVWSDTIHRVSVDFLLSWGETRCETGTTQILTCKVTFSYTVRTVIIRQKKGSNRAVDTN